MNRLFVISFENYAQRTSNKRYYLPNVEIRLPKIHGKIFFDQPVKNDKIRYEDIRKIATGQGDVYTNGCLFDYFYLIIKVIAAYLSKPQALDPDP